MTRGALGLDSLRSSGSAFCPRRSAQCFAHSDCKSQSLCFESRCIAATRVRGSLPCNKDRHCKKSDIPWRNRGRGCKCGRCYELKSSSRITREFGRFSSEKSRVIRNRVIRDT
ncbi:hypothetical protein M514_00102 [Trichuris suis]|uniref:Uncharacterized protein n=1 Tax=Trichuris suis TaxID=68888 RepID=A0A085NU22_9BILA|nr:hypothetical protein M513_00102 [Trichuris suis]KFD72968.1 hypothetical protein M514_00102 [Trichuris suis]